MVRQHKSSDPQTLSGLEKAAWWSVPALGAIALACALALAILYVNKPQPEVAASARTPLSQKSPGQEPRSASQKPEAKQVEAASPAIDPNANASENESERKKAEAEKADAAIADPPEPNKVPVAASVSASATATLLCADGQISFRGLEELRFVEEQPSIEVLEENGTRFEYLAFNGENQSVEVPNISRSEGSLEMLTKMPDRKTSIFLDSNFQRLTLRKNRDGLRWRVAGLQKPAKIRVDPKPVNFNKWHHIVVTWKSGAQAILYVDGVEHDRYAYVHQQPRFADYQDVVLGRTRGPDGRFYECRINRFRTFSTPLSAAEVAILNQNVRQSYPFVFK